MPKEAAELAEPTRKPLPPLPTTAAKLRESTNNSWRIVIPRGTPRERLLDSDLYATLAERFLVYDKLHLVSEDSTFYAELLVIASGRGYCRLVELSYVQLPVLVATHNDLPNNHEIVHGGPDDLYIVRRISDGVVLGKGFSDRQTALAFLLDHASLR